MAEYTPVTVPFSNKGMAPRVSSSSLQEGQYQKLLNMVSLQEGSIQTRNGYRRITTNANINNNGDTLVFIHTLGRLSLGSTEASNFRYLGEGQNIYRVAAVDNPTIGAPIASLGVTNFGHHWQTVPYRKFSSGFPYAYFATPSQMLKDPLTDNAGATLGLAQKWGIDRPAQPATVALGAALPQQTFAGNCNTQQFTVIRTGGNPFDINWASGTAITINAQPFVITSVQDQDHLTLQTNAGYQTATGFSVTYASTAGPNATILDYKYVYTLRNPKTGQESNPSMLMPTGIIAQHQAVQVTVSPITAAQQLPGDVTAPSYTDQQVSGPNSIAIYRSGGSLTDGFYRRVGFTQPNTTSLVGTLSTAGLVITSTGGNNFSALFPGAFVTINGVGYAIDHVVNPTSAVLRSTAGTQAGVAWTATFNASTSVVFTDTVSDLSIASNPPVQFDNDPPVTSTLPLPFQATTNGFQPGPVGINGAYNQIALTVQQGFASGQTKLSQVLRPGTILRIGSGTTMEFVVLQSIPADLGINVWLQYAHVNGEMVQTDSVANAPCSMAVLAFDSMFLAGDPNNPNVLYKSKTGQPESFPVVSLADGSPGSIEVGTPSNPIMAITEFNSEFVSLNKSGIYLVRLWNGAMQSPITTPAQRGLIARWGWCKADNEIWYMAYDGVYSWSGGQSVKRSEAIDPIFKGETVNGFSPISLSAIPDSLGITDLDRIQFYYERNTIFIIYSDIFGQPHRLRYYIPADRWSQDEFFSDATAYKVIPTAMLLEEDTGNLLLATTEDTIVGGVTTATISYLNQDDVPAVGAVNTPFTNDGFANANQDNGRAITWEAFTGNFTGGMPSMQKQLGDVILELENLSDGAGHVVTVQTYYDFSATPDATDTFTIAAAPGRRRVALSMKSGSAQEAYAVAFRITGTSLVPVHLHSLTFNYLTLEQIQVGRALDWDNLAYPYDKKLQQISIEYDTQGANVILNLDTMSGISPGVETQAVQTFTLTSPASSVAIGPVRTRANFPITLDTVAKMIRLRPTVSVTNFKIWNYNFDFIKYPPDKVTFTDWEDLGYPCDKLFREVVLTIDTGDTDCLLDVWLDGQKRQTFTIHTTSTDRQRIITFNQNTPVLVGSDIIGKTIRMVLTPAANGKAQLFNYKYNWIPEPCAVLHWDSFEQAFGYDGFKFVKQMWVEYVCDSSITVKTYRDSGQLLLSTTLPRHDFRNVERFPLPPVSTRGFYNKSKTYRFTIDPCNTCAPFKLYRDSTRVEVMMLSGDQRQAYQQAHLWEPIPIPIE